MNPITIIAVADAVLKYGPGVVSILKNLSDAIAAGRGDKPLTPEDWAELNRLAQQSSADIYAHLGITPPK